MDWENLFYRLKLHNNFIFNQQINSVPGIKLDSIIYNGQTDLALNFHPSFS